MKKRTGICVSIVVVVCAGVAMGLANGQTTSKPRPRYPDEDIGADSLSGRKEAQIASEKEFKVFYGFHFTEKRKESGITFVHRAVDDVTRHDRTSHYDHGTGLAAADVDGDGLYDLYFVNQAGRNELWKNLGSGKFKNITEEAGVGMRGRISVGAAFADVNNTGRSDLFVTTVKNGNVLFRNDGKGHFTDITKESGLGLVAHSSGAFFFDYDKDGLLDLLVCNVGKYTNEEKGPDGEWVGLKDAFDGHLYPERFEYPVLYKNLGNYRFKDVTAEVGLRVHGWCGDAGFADVNGDGWPDVYIMNMQGPDSYWENEGGKKFVNKTAEYFPITPWGSMGIKFFDYDNDGRVDLFVTDMHSDMSQEPGPEGEKLKSVMAWPESYLAGKKSDFIFGNALWHQLPGRKFEEVSDKMGVETYWPWGVSAGDLNADGWEDVFIPSGMSFPYRYGINSVLLNNRGEKFLQAEFILGVEPRRSLFTPWFEIDCSHDADAMQGVNRGVCAGQSGKVTAMAPRSSRSSVILDVDNDGDLDIVTNDFNTEPQLFVSDLAQRKSIHWLKIVLTGTSSNREGIGAEVRVRAGGQTYTKWNDGKSGYLSQSDLPLYFGLGDATKVDSVEVDWPSGRKQAVTTGLEENQTIRITEPR